MAFRGGRLRAVGIGGTLQENSTSLGALRQAPENVGRSIGAVREADTLLISTAAYDGTFVERLNPERDPGRNRRVEAVGVAV
jgi:hypothetical protein